MQNINLNKKSRESVWKKRKR